ncbi:MAG: peptide-methionine (S)-S-oxide reductase MsrA, partial [Spirochaetales bacterium]
MTNNKSPRAIMALAGTILFLAGSLVFAAGTGETGTSAGTEAFITPAPAMEKGPVPDTAVVAVFAGGCFWGIEGVYERLVGVYDVVSGYSGGNAETATYGRVGTGTTGHAESVKIWFDPNQISYRTLLDVFFTVAHNPTELNFQGPDHGPQYRSAVFYADDTQRAVVEEYITGLESRKVYGDPIVTQVTPLVEFFPAEEYHQDFMRNNPNYPYIVYWDLPKIAMLEKEFPELVA